MNARAEFLRMMATHTDMALATVSDNHPNVPIVNFVFDPDTNILYFATFQDNEKVFELSINPYVAFTTIPRNSTEHVKAKGVAVRSARSIYDVAPKFISKIPGYQDTIDMAGDALVVFEVRFPRAVVTLELDQIDTLEL